MKIGKYSGTNKAVEFVGMFAKHDVQSEKKRLESIIDNHKERGYLCDYDLSTGLVNCCYDCASDDMGIRCPDLLRLEAERQLDHVNTQPLMRLAFSNPKLAFLNDFLRGEKLIYGHQSVIIRRHPMTLSDLDVNRNILRLLDEWHCPKLREIKFWGIFVQEGWNMKSRYLLFSVALALLFTTILTSKFIFGEWGTAWTVGTFFLTLGISSFGFLKTENIG